MTEFTEMFCEMLPANSTIQNENNEFRKLFDRSVGTYMEEHDDIYEELFLTSATGGWLDAHGKDYGVVRKTDESDESYRQRIIFEKLENLTSSNLMNIYNVKLYEYVDDYDANENTLTTDNQYIPSEFMMEVDFDVFPIIFRKFVVSNPVYPLWDNKLDYIIDKDNNNILWDNLDVYAKNQIIGSINKNFKSVMLHLNGEYYNNILTGNSNSNYLTNAKLSFSNATDTYGILRNNENLLSAEVYAPNSTRVADMFSGCTNITHITLYAPVVEDQYSISRLLGNKSFGTHTKKIEYLNLTIPSTLVDYMITVINSNNFQYLTTLIINGEEVDLS